MDYTIADERKFRELAYKWAMAWDKKDKDAFISIATSRIIADYTDYPAVGVVKHCPPDDFVNFAFREDRLGDPRCKLSPRGNSLFLLMYLEVQTQHFLGSVAFTRVNDTEAIGNWQVRARHVRKFPDGKTAEWDSSAYLELCYVLTGGEWKIGGLRPHTVLATTGSHQEVIGQF
ncbi:Scytalone dehydratase [Penicillium roqueforti FM164]|uniref:Scytalone dehydratase n=1 Tax=Penicillium roqueforti (strain FM164) TaxID=1365484 RepID=W6Q752_PENRF|nr:Scytalone dehydratase [Penicillium roqueforti FM164]